MLTEKDILLIQNKVDGTLSPGEEDRFSALLDSSPQAGDLYRKLMAVHEEMNNSAARIPGVDITNRVMHRISDKTFTRRLFSGSGKVYAFAASLVLVFVLGALMATYLVPFLKGDLSQDRLAGTMARKKPSSWTFHDKGVDIEVQQHQKSGLPVYWMSVSSADSLYMEFSAPDMPVNADFLKIIDFDGLVQKAEHTENKISYICRGNAVFALTGPPDRSSLSFSLEGKQAFCMKFPPTF